jgi:hypothetical protein
VIDASVLERHVRAGSQAKSLDGKRSRESVRDGGATAGNQSIGHAKRRVQRNSDE